MRTWFLGLTLILALSAGCGGADQNSGSSGGTGGSGTTSTAGSGGSTGGTNTGGSTGGGGATGGTNTGGTGGSTGGGGATGGTNTGGTGGCSLITEDASKIGASCDNGAGCPTGYTCHEFAGITVTHSCAILCEQDCQCPPPTLCTMRSDKASSWKECIAP